MKKLTTEELTEYNKKKKLLLDIYNVLGSLTSFSMSTNLSYISPGIHRIFTTNEKLTEDFINELVPILKDFGASVYTIYNGVPNTIKDITEDEALNYIEEYITLLRAQNTPCYYYDTIMTTIKQFAKAGKIESAKLINLLLTIGFFQENFIRRDSVNEFLDDVVVNGNIENAEKFIAYVKKEIPEYKGFPLIVINHNINREEKIKALKLVYIQKDFPKYKVMLGEELKDMNDLDDFIEATVIQNNRVREKDSEFSVITK